MILRDIEEQSELEAVLKIGCAHPDNHTVSGGLHTTYFIRRFTDLWKQGIAHMFGLFTDAGRVVGALGFFVVPNIFNRERHAIQNFWFTLPEHRGRGVMLLKEYERQARKFGCHRMQMPVQLKRQSERFGTLFERYGFEAQETSYFKLLEPYG